jgi:hypothetical protein
MKLQGCISAKDAWEKLARLHQMDDEGYRVEIRNQLSTIVMSQAHDPETFLERYETLPMVAKVPKLDLSEAAKCRTPVVPCWYPTTIFEANGVRDSPKPRTKRTTMYCQCYSIRMCCSYNARRTRSNRM